MIGADGIAGAGLSNESDIVRRLACYLRANPLAADTKEGITQWWLGLTPASVDLVERALAELQLAGIVQSARGLDGHVRYRRTPASAAADARLDRIARGEIDTRRSH
jgi:hypothetical protein